MVSHDRSPLSSLSGALSLLEQCVVSPERRQVVRLAQASEVQLWHPLNDLIDLATADLRQFNLTVSLFSVATLFEQAADFICLFGERRWLAFCIKIDAILLRLIAS
jgi:K+-sensing histidine kinase KdpD